MSVRTGWPMERSVSRSDLTAAIGNRVEKARRAFGTLLKQQVVDQSLVLQRERSEFARKRKHDMHIARRQQFSFPCLEPAQARVALESWAMAVTTRVIRDGSMSAFRALIAMSTERGGAAARDRRQHFFVLSVDPLAIALDE